jgi:hypothetical protein
MKQNATTKAALSLLAELAPETQALVWRRLALRHRSASRLSSSPTDHELRFVAALAASTARAPGWSFTYVQRRRYDASRPSSSRSSASLVRRYGSWAKVCREADRLIATESPGSHPHAKGKRRGKYDDADVVVALRECAQALGRPPSMNAYSAWRTAAQKGKRTARDRPTSNAICRHYAQRGGWRGATEDACLIDPPRTSVRATLPSATAASTLAAVTRASGTVVAHHREFKWIEIQGTLAAARQLIAAAPHDLGLIVLWDPQTRTLERLDPSRR